MLYANALRAILTFKGSWKFSRGLDLHGITPLPPRHGAHLAGAAPLFQKLRSSPLTSLPSHYLSGVQSVLMLSQQLPKCNNYSFYFSPLMCGDNRGLEGWWWKRGCTVRVREYLAIWQRKCTHTKAWDKSKWFLKKLLWVSRDAALIFTFFFLSLFVRQGPEYFSSLMDASAVTLP